MGSFDGGYFSSSWGWAALAFVWVALLALLLGGQSVQRHGGIWLVALVLFTLWLAASAAWSSDQTRSVLETERMLVYVAATTAVLLILRPSTVPHLAGGVVAGIAAVAVYALATRLFPERLAVFDPISGYRLAEPVGYWNVLGLAAAMGALLAFGFVARARSSVACGAAGAALVVFLPTVYFTFGSAAHGSRLQQESSLRLQWIRVACQARRDHRE
ncbi:MAG: hypothetical protein ABI717_08095 [Actinomycetota bacterium]